VNAVEIEKAQAEDNARNRYVVLEYQVSFLIKTTLVTKHFWQQNSRNQEDNANAQ
jgi:hypothetical protein